MWEHLGMKTNRSGIVGAKIEKLAAGEAVQTPRIRPLKIVCPE